MRVAYKACAPVLHLFTTLWKTGDGIRVPYKYVHPFLNTGADVYRGPVFHHLFTTSAISYAKLC